jgi:outer membrane lipoprotein-sorting protein
MVPIHSHLAEENVGRIFRQFVAQTGSLLYRRLAVCGAIFAKTLGAFLPLRVAPKGQWGEGRGEVLDHQLFRMPFKFATFARFCLCLLLLLSTPLSHAADYDAQFNKWFEVQTNLQSWSGEFTQTRTLSVLNQPLITPGKVWVKPGEFRWELGQPVQSIILRTPDALLIVYPRFKRAEKYSLGVVPSGPMKDALALMDASLPRDRATMEEHFKLISADLTNSILQMTLQPRSESARKMIGQVKIGFHTNDYLIAETEMKFADGSTLHNNFTNIVINQPLAPELFDEKLPADYTVSEPLKQ